MRREPCCVNDSTYHTVLYKISNCFSYAGGNQIACISQEDGAFCRGSEFHVFKFFRFVVFDGIITEPPTYLKIE